MMILIKSAGTQNIALSKNHKYDQKTSIDCCHLKSLNMQDNYNVA